MGIDCFQRCALLQSKESVLRGLGVVQPIVVVNKENVSAWGDNPAEAGVCAKDITYIIKLDI